VKCYFPYTARSVASGTLMSSDMSIEGLLRNFAHKDLTKDYACDVYSHGVHSGRRIVVGKGRVRLVLARRTAATVDNNTASMEVATA